PHQKIWTSRRRNSMSQNSSSAVCEPCLLNAFDTRKGESSRHNLPLDQPGRRRSRPGRDIQRTWLPLKTFYGEVMRHLLDVSAARNSLEGLPAVTAIAAISAASHA